MGKMHVYSCSLQVHMAMIVTKAFEQTHDAVGNFQESEILDSAHRRVALGLQIPRNVNGDDRVPR